MNNLVKSELIFTNGIPSTWKEIPNRYLFKNKSKKVGTSFNEYHLLSLTTNGVKLKNINDSGGKKPESYENYQTVNTGDLILCLFDLDCSAVFSGLSTYEGMITSAYNTYKCNEKLICNIYAKYWFDYVFSNRYYKMFSKSIRYTITGDVFNGIKTPIPPIEEQNKIANFLDEKCNAIDKLIDKIDLLINKGDK